MSHQNSEFKESDNKYYLKGVGDPRLGKHGIMVGLGIFKPRLQKFKF
jgi:hypothetical protein